MLALVGESGCGKSLTAQAAMRLLPPAVTQVRGQVELAGEDLCALPEGLLRRLRGRQISMIFQEPLAALDPLATVGSAGGGGHGAARRGFARAAVQAMLADVGISDPARRAGQYPFELSGGMAQRVMIATALIARPAVLIADEPTTALDVTIQAQILELLRRLAADRGTAVLLITHDMGVVADAADRVAVMYAGRIAEIGRAEAVFTSPRHPYTALLLAALPRLTDQPKSVLAVIEGQVPPPGQFPPGCRFAGRCPLAVERCRAEAPPLRPGGRRAPVRLLAGGGGAVTAALAVTDLVVHYPARHGPPVRAVDGVSLTVAPGETLGLVGESGCGKSSVARAIVGLQAPTGGSVVVDGVEIAGAGRRTLARGTGTDADGVPGPRDLVEPPHDGGRGSGRAAAGARPGPWPGAAGAGGGAAGGGGAAPGARRPLPAPV